MPNASDFERGRQVGLEELRTALQLHLERARTDGQLAAVAGDTQRTAKCADLVEALAEVVASTLRLTAPDGERVRSFFVPRPDGAAIAARALVGGKDDERF